MPVLRLRFNGAALLSAEKLVDDSAADRELLRLQRGRAAERGKTRRGRWTRKSGGCFNGAALLSAEKPRQHDNWPTGRLCFNGAALLSAEKRLLWRIHHGPSRRFNGAALLSA